MQLPTIPTDNLYKFMSLSGVLITLFFVLISVYSIYNIEIKMLEVKRHLNIMDAKIEILDRLKDNHIKYMNILSKLLQEKEITKKEFHELEHKELLIYHEHWNNFELDIKISRNNFETLKKSRIFGIIILFFSILGAFTGIILAKKGFKLWYEKLQVYQDRNIKDLNSNKITYKKRT